MAGLLAATLNLDRKSVWQLMLSQPIVAGPLVGLCFGSLDTGLRLGAVLQLLWAGAINVGAAIPSHETLATVAIVATAALVPGAPDVPPSVQALAVLCLVPMERVGRLMDATLERSFARLNGPALADARRGSPRGVERAIGWAILAQFGAFAVVGFVAVAFGIVVVGSLDRAIPPVVRRSLDLMDALLPAVGVAGALTVLRSRRTSSIVTVAAALAAAALLITAWLWEG